MSIQVRSLIKYQWLVAVLMMLAISGLAGCQFFTTKAPQTAQGYINEANILLNSTAQVIRDNVRAGTMTRVEAQKALDKVKKYSKTVDEASALLISGKEGEAFNKAKLVSGLVAALHKELSKRVQ